MSRQYDAAATVPSDQAYIDRYAALSEAARARLEHVADVRYGSHQRERLDLFPARSADAPLFVFIHGGYWRRLDKSFFSFVAQTVVEGGGAAVVVNYPLAPEVKLDRIVGAVREAFAFAVRSASRLRADPRRVFAGGHSAGGQLTGMLAATDWRTYGLAPEVMRGAFPISGLFDLQPVRLSHVNEWMAMDEAEAERNSPQRMIPVRSLPLVASVGGDETAEFRRQSNDYAEAWRAAGHPSTFLAPAGHNHFSIVELLADPHASLTRALLELLAS